MGMQQIFEQKWRMKKGVKIEVAYQGAGGLNQSDKHH